MVPVSSTAEPQRSQLMPDCDRHEYCFLVLIQRPRLSSVVLQILLHYEDPQS